MPKVREHQLELPSLQALQALAILGAAYDETEDALLVRIAPGKVSVGKALVVKEEETLYTIASPSPDSAYHLFIGEDGSFFHNEDGTIPDRSLYLGIVETGSALWQIFITDQRTVYSYGGGYSKPEGGIPRSDLAQDAQDVLAEVETARAGYPSLGSRLDAIEQDVMLVRGIHSRPVDPGTIEAPGVGIYQGKIMLAYDSVGLEGKYYTSAAAGEFTTLKGQQIDAQIDFNWGSNPHPITGTATNWAARWDGYIRAPVTGTYTFYVTVDDGIRLWVNNQLIIESWKLNSQATYSGTIDLQAGKVYPIRVDYYQGPGAASIKLEWQAPGLSRAVVPQSALSPTGYVSSMDYESPVLDAGAGSAWLEVQITGEMPADTLYTFFAAFSDDGTSFSPWQPLPPQGKVFEERHRYAKYRLVMTTADPTQSPAISSIVWVRGSIIALDDLAADVEALEQAQLAHSARLDVIEQHQAWQDAQLAAIQQAQTDRDTRLDALEAEIVQARGTYGDLGARLDAIESSGGGGAGGGLAGLQYHEIEATAGQTVIDLPFSYAPGKNELLVFRNGVFQRAGSDNDYVESGEMQITFTDPLLQGDRIVVIRGLAASGSPKLWELHIASDGQDTFTLTGGTYQVGSHDLQVYRNGMMQVPGPEYDYVEVDPRTVRFNAPLEAGEYVLFRIDSGTSVSRLKVRRTIEALPSIVTPEVAPGSSYSGEIQVEEPVVVVVRIGMAPQAAVSAFRFEIFGDTDRTVLLYQFDAGRLTDYQPGQALFDPEFGYDMIPMRNIQGEPVLYYTIHNDDPSVASAFAIDLEIERLSVTA